MIKVTSVRLAEASRESGAIWYSRVYTSRDGLECKEFRKTQRESDYHNGLEFRVSPDNGRTWGEWQTADRAGYSKTFGEDEYTSEEIGRVWNPVHEHYVCTLFTRFFLGGHKKAYSGYWSGKLTVFDHQYIRIYRDGEDTPISEQMMKYEEGAEFDPENPRNEAFLTKNIGFLNPPIVLKDGDIAVPVSATVRKGCELAGLDVTRVFPNTPDIHRCVLVARGVYNKESGRYDFSYSNPVILNDLVSSRGIDEPQLVELASGRLLLVMRGSNLQYAPWKTRIEKGTPAFKWYAYSDDGGATFTGAMPWHFDNGEMVYSAATISAFLRSSKNGQLYWVGNVSDHTAYANGPRFPLHIAQIDETLGVPKRETLTVIDTKRESESDEIQLSNFSLMEDRESGHLEVALAKLCQYGGKENSYFCDAWRYYIELDAEA